jgi:hypothetical protein
MARRTTDLLNTATRFHTVEKLGRTRYLTPEGFLVCVSVPVARTGEMLYLPSEVPVTGGKDGIVRVVRTEEDLFSTETIASFEGKPVVNNHPTEDVNAENWAKYAIGSMQNVRRGEGEFEDCLVADLMITVASAISDVSEGKREVSLGYDADYEELAPGKGRQFNIIGNHVALVERGRCGPRCAIGDEEMVKVNAKPKMGWKDRLRAKFMARDAEGVEEVLAEVPDATKDEGEGGEGGQHIHIHVNGDKPEDTAQAPVVDDEPTAAAGLEARVVALEETVATLAEAVAKFCEGAAADENEVKVEDDTKRTDDSGELMDAVSRAELLVPGIQVPNRDAMGTGVKFQDSLCSFKRKTLILAQKSEGRGRDALNTVTGGSSVKVQGLTCDAVGVMFQAATEAAKNMSRHARSGSLTPGGKSGAPGTIADINKRNADFWSKR